MIHIDASELRPQSKLLRHTGKLAEVFGYGDRKKFISRVSHGGLEAMTGADVMLSSLGMPVTSGLLPRHIEHGALLIQLKFGTDLTSSLGPRMKESLWRMRETGARQSQCILMFVGTLERGDGGRAKIDGRMRRPARGYLAVTTAIRHWCLRGGVYLPVSEETELANVLRAMELEAGTLGRTELWPELPSAADFSINDDPLEDLEKIEDWRVPFSALSKSVGPVKASELRRVMKESSVADSFVQALMWTSAPKWLRKKMKVPKVRLWGDKTFDSVRKAVFGVDSDEYNGRQLVLKLELIEVKDGEGQ